MRTKCSAILAVGILAVSSCRSSFDANFGAKNKTDSAAKEDKDKDAEDTDPDVERQERVLSLLSGNWSSDICDEGSGTYYRHTWQIDGNETEYVMNAYSDASCTTPRGFRFAFERTIEIGEEVDDDTFELDATVAAISLIPETDGIRDSMNNGAFCGHTDYQTNVARSVSGCSDLGGISIGDIYYSVVYVKANKMQMADGDTLLDAKSEAKRAMDVSDEVFSKE